MTAQEVFDIVANHLLTQGELSEDLNGTCVYRGPGGLRCAVGCVIPNEKYKPEMEGYSVYQLETKELLPEELVPHVHLLSDLQKVHDHNLPENWPDQLIRVAKKFNLSYMAVRRHENGRSSEL